MTTYQADTLASLPHTGGVISMTDKTPADLELDAEIERLSQVYPEISEPEWLRA